MTYNVYWTNHGFFAQQDFASFEEAVAHAKSVCFEATIIKPYHKGKPGKGGETVGTWSPIGGLHDRRTA